MSALGKRLRRPRALALALSAAALCLAAPGAARDLEFPTFFSPGLNPDLSPSSAPGGRPFELFNVFAVNQHPDPGSDPRAGRQPARPQRRTAARHASPTRLTFPRCSQEAFDARRLRRRSPRSESRSLDLSAGAALPPSRSSTWCRRPGSPPSSPSALLRSTVHIDFHIRSGSDYGATATVDGLSEAVGLLTSSVRIWGVPGDPGHDALRFTGGGTPAPGPYPEPPPFRPLLSNPTSCDGPLVTTMEATTWQHPASVVSAAPFEAPAMGGCDQLDFNPIDRSQADHQPRRLALRASTSTSTSPRTRTPKASPPRHLREVKFVLPAGLTVNPAAANGLGTCSPEQIGFAGAANERQLLRYDLPPVNFSGSFTVSLDGQSTAPIAATASRAEVAAALETLPGLAGNVSRQRRPGRLDRHLHRRPGGDRRAAA